LRTIKNFGKDENAMNSYNGSENFDLRQTLLKGRALSFHERTMLLETLLSDLDKNGESLCMRRMLSPAGREVLVGDSTGATQVMLMFGSNNYLGLADHPRTRSRVEDAIRQYGVGIGGPPLLNGYTGLHAELEERLAALKGCEKALVFSSGYGANVGLVTGVANPEDYILYDAYSHASFCDGVRMSGVQHGQFPHNDTERLRWMLERRRSGSTRDIFVGVEGVYSMDGDLAPLDVIVPLTKQHGAILIVDDAHGTGVMGKHGRGTAEHFHLEGSVDITMGTFSKTFAVTGGFVAGPGPVIDYLRYFARSYMFSASLPPPVIAAVLAGLDVMEAEPELLAALRENTLSAARGLRALGFEISGMTPIIPLRVPVGMNIRRMARRFHEKGIFMNMIEYPAVPVSQQRFRISLMATHMQADIDRLVSTVDSVWEEELRRSAEYAPAEKCVPEEVLS
jgi:glycine C-acetyltransferase